MSKAFENKPFKSNPSHQAQSHSKPKFNLETIRKIFAWNNHPPQSRGGGSR